MTDTKTETGWLIEAAGPRYWNGRSLGSDGFTEDPDKALRFARQHDAENVRCYLLDDSARRLTVTVEHGWADVRESEDSARGRGSDGSKTLQKL